MTSVLPENPVAIAREQLERIKRSWVHFGMDLKDFHDRERWRDLNYPSFEDCVENELGWGRAYVYRVLAATDTIVTLQSALSPMGDNLPLPTSERQTRELAPVKDDPQRLATTWKQAVDTAPRRNGEPQITAAHIADVIAADAVVVNEEITPADPVDLLMTLPQWRSLSRAQQQRVLARPRTKAIFNEQQTTNIEWARWSWNPVTGCRHNCSFCYARDIAARFYPQGFVPTFLPERLDAPRNTKVPPVAATDIGYKNVFTCSMADLFGKWVPSEWIDAVLESVAENPHWNFLFLTKFPQRLAEFSFPQNAWVGTTVDAQARLRSAEEAFAHVDAPVKWLSLEPLLEPLRFEHLDRFDWIVIGGATASTETPEWHPPLAWVADLEHQAAAAGVRVYHKTNLYQRRREYPGVELPPALNIPEAFHMQYLQRDVLEPRAYAREMGR